MKAHWFTALLLGLWSNRQGRIGFLILFGLIMISLFAPLIAPYAPDQVVGKPMIPPSLDHPLGTTRLGKDVLSQTLYGGRVSLLVGFFSGTLATLVAVLVGVSAAYFGRWVDEVLSFVMNLVLVLPAIALIIVIASSLESGAGPVMIGLVIAGTSWAWEGRLFRAQALIVSRREYVVAARVIGESHIRIILVQIIPNLTSLIASGFVLATLFCIVTEAGLEFIGIGDPQAMTWGVQLLHARTSNALIVGAWWELLVPSMMILLTGASLALINFAVDEVTNPRLRAHRLMAAHEAALSVRNLKNGATHG